MQHPWYEADVKIYTPRFGFSAALTGHSTDAAGDRISDGEEEQLSLWTPSVKQLSDCAADSRTTQSSGDQP